MVRSVKWLLGKPVVRPADAISALQTAMAGLKNESEALHRRLTDIESELERQKTYDDQLAALIEAIDTRLTASQELAPVETRKRRLSTTSRSTKALRKTYDQGTTG